MEAKRRILSLNGASVKSSADANLRQSVQEDESKEQKKALHHCTVNRRSHVSMDNSIQDSIQGWKNYSRFSALFGTFLLNNKTTVQNTERFRWRTIFQI